MQRQNWPEKIDKYQILSILGKGAMGVVYHAHDPIVKRDVALKLLSSIDLEETELISRFEREARLAGSLRHPNIVTIHDLGHFEGRPYIVMEYILGRDLEAVIKEKQPLTAEQKIDIILQIIKGLHAAHQKGIIHRDVKPANIRLQEDNVVKIMDFGIARMGTSQLTRSGYIIGTLQYMSPEQVSGEPLDPRTDLFSTGVIAYELFSSTNPFSGGTAVDIMYRILNLRPQPIQSLPEDFGSELNQVILRALEKNKELRYQTAKDMAQDLEDILFYIKTIRFRSKLTERAAAPSPHRTEHIPVEQLPVQQVKSEAPREMPTVAMDMQKHILTTLGATQPEKTPRTGVGANYSETAQQILMKPAGSWHERKFFVLGAILALLFIAGLFYAGYDPERGSSQEVVLNSNPAGAEIWIDGELKGKTPYTISEKKNAKILFRLPGYQDKELPLNKDAWPGEVNVTLEKTSATQAVHSIEINSIPSGATLLFDGVEKGQTPVSLTIPDDQSHELQLQLEGYESLKQNIDKKTATKLSLSLQALPQPGQVRYTGDYPATAFIDRKAVRGNPLSLAPGTYSITFLNKKTAYIKFTKTVEVVSGEAISISGPRMGKISIKANPSRCKISINGDYIDEAPIHNFPIQAGDHVIQFHWEQIGKRGSKSVSIDAGEATNIIGVPQE